MSDSTLKIALLRNWCKYGFDKPVYGIVDLKDRCFSEMDLCFGDGSSVSIPTEHFDRDVYVVDGLNIRELFPD